MITMNDESIASTDEMLKTDPTPEAAASSDAPTSPEAATAPEVTDSTATPAPDAPVAEAPAPAEAQAPAPAPAPKTPEPAMSDADLFEQAMAELSQDTPSREQGYRKLSKGDRIEATVIQVENDKVFVDLGTKSEGVVFLNELAEEQLESAHDHVKVGDKIQVVVIKPEGGADGNPVVSKKRADFEETWNHIIQSFQEGKMLNATVVDRVKGGLVVDIGVRGFVPATHVGNGKLRNIEKYVGQVLQLKVIEIDRDRKKVVLSNRQAEEERREEVKEKIFTDVSPGDILEGTVRRLTDYGAFIDLGGIDGLLHISEMSWMRINHPREVLKEGQDIKVMVLRLDKANSKISLGLRQVLPDPWNLIRENYRIGQKLECKISRLVQNGAFVKLPEGAEAFLPVSEIATRRIGKPSDVLTEGQEVEVVIIDLKPDERRMVLSLRAGGTQIHVPDGVGQEYASTYTSGGSGEYDDDRRGKAGGKKKKSARGRGGRDHDEDDMPIVGRVPTGGATIGERLGMLKGFLGREDAPEDEESTGEETPAEETEE